MVVTSFGIGSTVQANAISTMGQKVVLFQNNDSIRDRTSYLNPFICLYLLFFEYYLYSS